MESVPALNESGPFTVAPATEPSAPVYSIEFCIPETTRLLVEAMPVERDVVVAPVAVMFAKSFTPEKVLFVNVFGTVVDAPMNAFTKSFEKYLFTNPCGRASVVVAARSPAKRFVE